MEELKRIIDDSEITKEDDALWPPPDRVGRQVGVRLQQDEGVLLSVDKKALEGSPQNSRASRAAQKKALSV